MVEPSKETQPQIRSTMKNSFFTCDIYSGSLSSGGFSTETEARNYIRTTKKGRAVLLIDNRETPNRRAREILERTWLHLHTLTPSEYAELAAMTGFSDRPHGEHPAALYMALAASGLLAKWDSEERPRSQAWFFYALSQESK